MPLSTSWKKGLLTGPRSSRHLTFHAGKPAFGENIGSNRLAKEADHGNSISLVAGVTIILTGVKRKFHIGLTSVVSAVILSLFSGQAWSVLKVSLVETLLAPSNRTLLLAIALITILGRTMQVSGAMTALADSTQKLFRSPKGTILVLSSLMGFLSVPGASIFSAPMVDFWSAARYEH